MRNQEDYNFERYIHWTVLGVYDFIRKTNINELKFNIENFMGQFINFLETDSKHYGNYILCKLHKCNETKKYNAIVYSCEKVFEDIGCINADGIVHLSGKELDILEEILESYDESLFRSYMRRF